MSKINQRQRKFSFGVTLIAAALAGCSGGGGGPATGGDANTTPVTPDPTIGTISNFCDSGVDTGNVLTSSCVDLITSFSETAVENIRNDNEFSFQDSRGDSNSFSDINLEYALSLGLTGVGYRIAISDGEFLVTHPELAGKYQEGDAFIPDDEDPPLAVISDFDEDSDSHGTSVASVAAGIRDGNGMFGVASGADLYLISNISPDPDALRAAKQAGAIVQTHSWGFSFDPGDVTVDHVVCGRAGCPSNGLNSNYQAAFREFLDQGNIVFSNSNDRNLDSQSFIAASPSIYQDLLTDPDTGELRNGGWIATSNANITFDPDDGSVTALSLMSSKCLETASYCILGDGRTGFARSNITTGDPYGGGNGTSFVAPQVAGAIAVLAEAFTDPNPDPDSDPDNPFPGLQLKPREIVYRLLATANNSYYVPADAEPVLNADGTITILNDATSADDENKIFFRDFGNNVLHAYNAVYGHGFMDMRAALLPIGELVVTDAPNLDDSTLSLASARVTTSASVGNALVNSLGDTQLATFDALGAPFYMRAANLIKIDTSGTSDFQDELERFSKAGSFVSSDPDQLSDGWQLSFGGAPLVTLGTGFMLSPENVVIAGNYQPAKSRGGVSVGWRFHSGSTSVMAQGFGLAPVADDVFANSISILPTDGMSYGAVQVGEASSLGAFAFVEDEGGRFESTGFAFARASALRGGGLGTLGLVMKSEDYAFMGLKSGASDTDDFSGLAGALNFSAQWNLSGQVLGKAANSGSIFFNAEYGMAEGEGAALVQGFDTTTFSGYAVGLRFNEVLNDSDTLTVSVRQPCGWKAVRQTCSLLRVVM